MVKITVFTPSYNRGYIIQNLYESLLTQTYRDFEWLVVDDGSTDDTKEKVEKWIAEKKISIKYLLQKNGGKHRAYNRGVKEAKGELFFTVDSDDYLPANALERVIYHYKFIENDPDFAGVCGCRFYPTGVRIGGELGFDVKNGTQFDLRIKWGVKGDMADVVRTDILRRFPFPEVEGEKFCTEAMIFDQMSQKYKTRFFNENIYFCEYLPDGLTAKMTKVRMQSPITSTMYYAQLSKCNIPLLYKIKAYVNFWRFRLCINEGISKNETLPWYACLFYPVGLLMHMKDKEIVK